MAEPARFDEIEVDDAYRALERHRVVDVREPDEFVGELGHIPGSRLLPLGALFARLEAGESPDEVLGAPDGRPILFVCRSGNRSGRACERLLDAGRTQVVNLVGGMLAWNAAGLPVVRAPDDGAPG